MLALQSKQRAFNAQSTRKPSERAVSTNYPMARNNNCYGISATRHTNSPTCTRIAHCSSNLPVCAGFAIRYGKQFAPNRPLKSCPTWLDGKIENPSASSKELGKLHKHQIQQCAGVVAGHNASRMGKHHSSNCTTVAAHLDSSNIKCIGCKSSVAHSH